MKRGAALLHRELARIPIGSEPVQRCRVGRFRPRFSRDRGMYTPAQATDSVNPVRSLQPQCLANGRVGNYDLEEPPEAEVASRALALTTLVPHYREWIRRLDTIDPSESRCFESTDHVFLIYSVSRARPHTLSGFLLRAAAVTVSAGSVMGRRIGPMDANFGEGGVFQRILDILSGRRLLCRSAAQDHLLEPRRRSLNRMFGRRSPREVLQR